MKAVVILLAFASIVYGDFAVPAVPARTLPVLSRTEIRDDHGQYSLGFHTANGIGVAEHGVLKLNRAGTGYVLVKTGTYTYASPDGTPIVVNYVADENGFQPTGTHLPQPVEPLPVV